MKVKALVRFKDKYTKKVHKVDDEWDVTEERYEEILKKGKLVAIVEEPTETPEEPAEAPEEPTETPEEEKDKKKSAKKTTK